MKFKEIGKFFIGKLTNCYNYGKNNKVYFSRNGKLHRAFFMPRGLKVVFEGNDSVLKIEKPLKFINSVIYLKGPNAEFDVKHSKHKVRDAKFYVGENSKILIGKEVQMKNTGLVIISNNSYIEPVVISIGDETYIARDVLIRASDGHTVINAETKEPLNPPRNVTIGKNAWIGSRSVLLKGAKIPNNSIVGACSLVTKSFDEENVVIAGQPAKIIKHNITWDKRAYGTYRREFETVEENI